MAAHGCCGGGVSLTLMVTIFWFFRQNVRLRQQCHELQQDGNQADEALSRLAAAIREEESATAQRIARRVKMFNGTPSGQRFKRVLEQNPALRVES